MRRPLPAPRRTYLADSVYAALRRAIRERELDPGEPLTEQELSRRFRVSRTPVREALAKPAERLMAAHVRRVRDTIFRLLD